jgi:hypothetical protein
MSGMLKKEGFDLSDTGNGLSAMNSNDAGGSGSIVDGNQLKKFLLGKAPTKKDPAGVPGFGAQIENALPGASGGITQGVMDGTYYPTGLDNLDDKGAATTQLLEQVDKVPMARDNLGNNPEVRAAVLSRVDRDIDHAAALGLPIRESLQNARRIFAESGFEGLRAALKAGVVALPAAALILRQEQEQRPSGAALPPRGS